MGHKHNIFYLHYFRFQNHSTQRQSFSYCQRPQPPGQKLKAYFYISIHFLEALPVLHQHHPNQFDCSISALQLRALHLISHISCRCSNFDLLGICMQQHQQTAALQQGEHLYCIAAVFSMFFISPNDYHYEYSCVSMCVLKRYS